MGPSPPEPFGAVLAGGASTRLGRPKTRARLGAGLLIERPLAALRAVASEVVVVAKADTPLPALGAGVAVVHEPDHPRHPFAGIVAALARAGDRPLLVCALDLPFVGADLMRALVDAPGGHDVVIAAAPDGRWQPLAGRYGPAVAPALAEAAQAGRPVRSALARLDPHVVIVADAWALHNVNTAEDLARAEAHLAGVADQPNVKS